MQFKQRQHTVPHIARLLHVDAVVDGAVVRSADRVRITAQLVSGDTGENIWAQALQVDPHLAEAHTMLANAQQQEWRWREAEAGHRRAIELGPSDATAHLGLATFLAARARTEEAIDAARCARDLDPLSLQSASALGVHFYFARRYDEAIRQFRSVQDMEPSHVWSLRHLGLALRRYPGGRSRVHANASKRF